MKKEQFNELLQAVQQMRAFRRGEKVPGLTVKMVPGPLSAEDVRVLRTKVLKLTQEGFAVVVGESVEAVRSWEGEKRRPGGAASKIMRLLKKEPKLAKQLALA